MTAQGIMNGAGSAMNAMFSGLPAAGGFVKGMQGASFEQFMETSKGGNGQTEAAPVYERGAKEEFVQPKEVNERAKELFSGERIGKEAGMSQAEDAAEVSEEAAEAVFSLLVQVRQVICETLGITDEQLAKAMDELGLQDADLLERDSLQQVFLNLKQAEPTEFLTNEGLFDAFADLVQTVEQTVDASGVTPEKVKAVTEALNEIPQVGATEVPEGTAELAGERQEQNIGEEDTAEAPVEYAEAENVKTAPETKAETGDTGEDRHMAQAKKDGRETTVSSETDANVRQVFIDALANHAAGETAEASLATAAQVREIANQIMEQMKITIRPEQTNMELQLNPEHLGRVNLTITEKEGMMTAQFTTQTEVAKEAIESQMTALRESLQNQGIKVEAIEVTVSEFGFERDRQSEENGNGEPEKKRKSGAFTVEDTEEAGPQMADYLNVTDSSVDYSA